MGKALLDLSILIVNYNTREHLRRCLRSLEHFPPHADYEVLVIDNASSDGSAEMVAAEFPACRLLRSSTNDGYGVAINSGMQDANGRLLMFLNPDIEVSEHALDTLIEFAATHPKAGVISPRLIYGDGQPQPSARRFISPGFLLLESTRLHLLLPARLRGRLFLGTYFAQDRVMEVPWVSGACHLIPRSVWDEVGLLTEETFCGSDDYDYCYRVRQHGYEVWLCATATMTHYCSVAVRERWNTWEVEQVGIHNFCVVLESHWPKWRLKTFYVVEILSHLIEGARHLIKARPELKTEEYSYQERLKRRLALSVAFLFGRQKPIHRFQPQKRYESSATRG